jgi:hypothetical protein
MSMFTERLDEFTPELREAGAWLSAEAERLAGEKGLDTLRWEYLYGQRQSGGAGGVPQLSQWGFQVVGVDTATGEALELRCFLDEDTVVENPTLAARILDLWMDRLSPD